MTHQPRISRAVLSLLLAFLVTGSGFVPTLLERDVEVRVSLESEHDPSQCPRVHDHSVCTQINSTQGFPAQPERSSGLSRVVRITENPTLGDLRGTLQMAHPPARAPPA